MTFNYEDDCILDEEQAGYECVKGRHYRCRRFRCDCSCHERR